MFTTIILLIIGSLLIFLNIRAINKEKNSFEGMLNETSDNMREFEVEIGKLRREFAETLLELQTQIVDLEKMIKSKEDLNNNEDENIGIIEEYSSQDKKSYEVENGNHKEIEENDDKKISNLEIKNIHLEQTDEIEESEEEKKDVENNESNNSIKINEIEKLIEEGLSLEEISDKLKIGKGEILLIKELYLK
ncbi:hypothetical protein [Clostridium ganghwense]|uniref:Uncharacterized protein n=1 Tax=Clostridium ganghwense TaxID=312089 RepID=A0ABT4CMT5_9CLOT|nr:hypothetical protein [Clostridium ganghwense]MCY6370370.1 hypothetical protein [Clostridium ganghwense]